jgi:hypothetical protein
VSDEASKTELDLVGLQKGAPEVLVSGKTIFLGGQAVDQAGFLAMVNAHLTPFETVHERRTLLSQAMTDRLAKEAEAKAFIQDVKTAAANSFGENSVEFQKLGFKPKKKAPPLTPEEKQQKYERLLATRKARNTLGKKQRRNVKGVNGTPAGNEGSPAAPSSTSNTKP